MKTNPLACLLLLLLSVALGLPAQQPRTSATATNEPRRLTDAELGFVPDSTNQSATSSLDELRAMANSGDASAQYRLGEAYERGDGVPQDNVEAVKWYRKAAERGRPDAQRNLGYLYIWGGKGVPANAVEGERWSRKAAEQGDKWAQQQLGFLYNCGMGAVRKDYAEAAKWYRKAAEQGHVAAQKFLGYLFLNGEGVDQNYNEAAKWLRKAAEQGDAESQYRLGEMYTDGDGVLQDFVEAYMWLNLAAASDDMPAQVKKELSVPSTVDAARTARDRLARRMASAQIAEGQRRAGAFKPQSEAEQGKPDSPRSSAENMPTATGTGFFITSDGYLISNYHVVKEARKVRLLTAAGLIEASVVKVDAAIDLALLKALGRFAPLPVSPSRGVKLGGTVATVGFPDIGLQGFSPKLAKGEIASLAGSQDDARYFQISVPVQPGNSGGALVDGRGNVVGIVAAKLSARAALEATGALPENVNYAVKSSFLLGFLESLPEVSAKLKEPKTQEEKFEDVVKSAQEAAVLVLVY